MNNIVSRYTVIRNGEMLYHRFFLFFLFLFL